MRRGRMAVVALAAVAALSACGGSDEPESATPTSAGPTPNAAGSPASTPPAPSERSVRVFCDVTQTFNRRLTTAALGVGEDPTQVQRFVDELRTAAREVADAAPADISADTRIITDAVDQFARSVEEEGFDPGRIPGDAAAALTGPEVQQASQKVEAYMNSRCPTDR